MRIFRKTCGINGVNCYLREDGVIIDPGMGSFAWIRIMCRLEKIKPKMILLTSIDPSHFYDASLIAIRYALPIYMYKDENTISLSPSHITRAGFRDLRFYPDDGFLAGLRVLPNISHAQSSVILMHQKYIFTGDSILTEALYLRKTLYTDEDSSYAITIYPGHGKETILGYERRSNNFLD